MRFTGSLWYKKGHYWFTFPYSLVILDSSVASTFLFYFVLFSFVSFLSGVLTRMPPATSKWMQRLCFSTRFIGSWSGQACLFIVKQAWSFIGQEKGKAEECLLPITPRQQHCIWLEMISIFFWIFQSCYRPCISHMAARCVIGHAHHLSLTGNMGPHRLNRIAYQESPSTTCPRTEKENWAAAHCSRLHGQ